MWNSLLSISTHMDVYIVLCLGIVTKPCFKCAKLQALTKMNSQSSKDKNNVHVKTLFSFIKTFGYNVLWVNFELITKHITRKSRSNPWNFVFMRFAVEDSSKTFFFFFCHWRIVLSLHEDSSLKWLWFVLTIGSEECLTIDKKKGSVCRSLHSKSIIIQINSVILLWFYLVLPFI